MKIKFNTETEILQGTQTKIKHEIKLFNKLNNKKLNAKSHQQNELDGKRIS